MIFAFHFLMMTIFIFFTLMVMINGLPIESKREELKSFLRSKRSIWLKRAVEEVIDINGMIKRGVIQSADGNDYSVPSAYRFNKKKRFNPIDYPIDTKLLKRDQDHGVASSNTKDKQVEKREDSNQNAKTIATANLTPAAVNHTPVENNGRAAVDSKTSSSSSETKANSISLPNGVIPSSQGFLFLPVSKPSENSNKSTESTSSSSNSASQTYFFNIASPTGGSVSKFEVKSGGGDDDGKPISSPGSKSNNNDVTKSAPSDQQSEKTRIIFKPLNDPDAGSKSVPITKPSSSNDDIQEKASVGNHSAQTKGASDPHADDKSTNDKNDEKSPTSSQSTVGANEKKNDFGDDGGNSKQSPSQPPKENNNHNSNKDGGDGGNKKGGENKGEDSGKGKGGGDGGDDNSKSSSNKSGDGGSDNGQTPKSQVQTGSGNGNGKGGNQGDKSETTAKNTNNDASPPKQSGSEKEDDYYLFPVEQDNKTVELNKGDMVAYVDHPQLAASKMTGKPSKRNLSTFTKRSSNNAIHPNTLKRREIIQTITLTTRRQAIQPTLFIKRNHPTEKRPILIRSLSLAFKPIKHFFSRTNLQPGKVGVTPTYWHGQPLV